MVRIKLKFIIIPISYILLTFVYFLIVIFTMLKRTREENFVEVIPGKTLTDLLFLFFGIPLLIILTIFIVEFATIVNFKFSKKFLRNYNFYYVNLEKRPLTVRTLLSRPLLPVFMALALSHMLNTIPRVRIYLGAGDTVISIIVLSLILAPITAFLLLPVWIFKDNGIIKVRKKQICEPRPSLPFLAKSNTNHIKDLWGFLPQ